MATASLDIRIVVRDPESMAQLFELVVQHGYVVIPLVVFVEAVGVPVPEAAALVAPVPQRLPQR